jgi:hypothetical protein
MTDRRISEKSANLGQLDAIWYALVWTGLEHATCEHKTPYHDLLCTAVKEQQKAAAGHLLSPPRHAVELRFVIP